MSERRKDWCDWFAKLKWQLISFKFLSFWVFIVLLVGSWYSLAKIHERAISVAETLFKNKMINQAGVVTIITHSYSVLYDAALSHLLIFFGATIASVIAIKGMSYFTDSQKTRAVISKMESSNEEDLKKYLPKNGA